GREGRAPRKREGDGKEVDSGTREILHAVTAGTIGPFVGWMLVGPRGASAVGLHYFKYGVDPQVLMRKDRLAAAVRIAGQKVGIDAPIKLSQIGVNAFIQLNYRSTAIGARTRSNSAHGIRGRRRREVPVEGHVVPEARGSGRAGSDQSRQAGKRVAGERRGWIGVGLAMFAEGGER